MATNNNQNKLGKALWAVANELRGAMMADDFRDYMLSFLFWKYLSDNYLKAAKKELGSDYPDNTQDDVMNNLGATTYLEVWYYENKTDIELFEEQTSRIYASNASVPYLFHAYCRCLLMCLPAESSQK